MEKNLIKQVVIEQAKEALLSESLLQRDSYRAIEPFVNTPQVILLSGVRRCGKSTWMQMLRKRAALSNYYLNFDDDRLVPFQLEDCQQLIEVFIELYGEQNTFYFDEMQNLARWERFVRRLHNSGKKIFVTGSNANLLSREFGTHLTGRNIKLHLFPYSFREYVEYKQANLLKNHWSAIDVAFLKKYILEFKKLGGFPEYLAHQSKQYLRDLYEDIIYKDVIVRNKLTNADVIKRLVYYLASNNAKEFTYNSLRKFLQIKSSNTVSEYCHYLSEPYLCFIVERFSLSVRKQSFSPKKIYFIDQALAECVGFRFSEDGGRTLENIVYLQLLRKNYDVYYHKEKKECDFVTRDGFGVGQAIQVCTNLNDPKTKKREVDGLIDAMQTYDLKTGLIITEDESGEETITHDGKKYQVVIRACWEWLLMDFETR